MEQKYLIAMDGSGPSMVTAHYAAAMLPKEGSEIVLFLVEFDIPESFWDIYPEPETRLYKESMVEWAGRQSKSFASSLELARKVFINAGFPEKAVTIKMQRRKTGITRDIVAESLDGYAAVFAGRKGFSNLSRLPVGSIARKLVSRIQNLPLVLVGDNPETRHVLIGFDDSHGSRRCLHLAADLFGGRDKQFHIRHVARSIGGFSGLSAEEAEGGSTAQAEQEYARKLKIEPALAQAAQLLQEKGVASENVDTGIIHGYVSRSLGLIDTAEREKWGTLLVGRRGLSRIQDFLIGRVGEKLVEMAREQTVWIIS